MHTCAASAAAKRKLEDDLIKMREEKRQMEETLKRMPHESHKRHQEEAQRLRTALEASREKACLLEHLLDLKGAGQADLGLKTRFASQEMQMDAEDAGSGQVGASRSEGREGGEGARKEAGPVSALEGGDASSAALSGTIEQLLMAQRRVARLEEQLQAASQERPPKSAEESHITTGQPHQSHDSVRHLLDHSYPLLPHPIADKAHRLLSVSRNKIALPRLQAHATNAAGESEGGGQPNRPVLGLVLSDSPDAPHSRTSRSTGATHAPSASAAQLYTDILSIHKDYQLATVGKQ